MRPEDLGSAQEEGPSKISVWTRTTILQKNRDRNQDDVGESVEAHSSPRGTERTRTSAAPSASASRSAQGHSGDGRQQ